MEKSVLAELRRNVNCGKAGCLDLSLPSEAFLLKAKDFKLLFEVLECVLGNIREGIGACYARIPAPSDKNMIRQRRNLGSYLRRIKQKTSLPLIIDAAYTPKTLWGGVVAKLKGCRLVLRAPDKLKIGDYRDELYYYIPRKIIDHSTKDSKYWQVRETRFSSDFEFIRKALGENTILLVSENGLSSNSRAEHKECKNCLMLLHPNMVFSSLESINIFRQRLNQKTDPAFGKFEKAS